MTTHKPKFDAVTFANILGGNNLFGTIKWLVNPLAEPPVTPINKYNGHPKTAILKI